MIIITIVFGIDFGSHLKTNFISMSIVFGIDFGSHVKPNLIILSIVFGIGFGSLFEAKKFVKKHENPRWHQIAPKIDPKIHTRNDHLFDYPKIDFQTILGPKLNFRLPTSNFGS